MGTIEQKTTVTPTMPFKSSRSGSSRTYPVLRRCPGQDSKEGEDASPNDAQIALHGGPDHTAKASETIRVTIDKLKFDPLRSRLMVDDTIEWPSSDFVAHIDPRETRIGMLRFQQREKATLC